jgi:hypothetical protein
VGLMQATAQELVEALEGHPLYGRLLAKFPEGKGRSSLSPKR